MRHLGKTVLHGLLLGAAAGALTVGFASTSHAGAVAFSSLQISGFQILKADGSPLSALTDFDVLEVNNFTAAEARLNGSGPTGDPRPRTPDRLRWVSGRSAPVPRDRRRPPPGWRRSGGRLAPRRSRRSPPRP